jgi:hypothetical protein
MKLRNNTGLCAVSWVPWTAGAKIEIHVQNISLKKLT